MSDADRPSTDDEPTAAADEGGHDDTEPLTAERLMTPEGASRARLALLAVAVLAVGFVLGGVLTGGGGDDGGNADGGGGDAGGELEIDPDEPLPFPTGDVNRVNYWRFGDLEPLVQDTFDRPDDDASLGESGSGQAWTSVNGTWGIQGDSAAALGGGTGQGPRLAVVAEGNGDGLTEVTMTRVEAGAGLVFRYLDPDNHWSVTANPGIGTWVLSRVIDGEAQVIEEIPGPTSDGVTVSVTQSGSVVRVLLEGDEYVNITDAALADQLQGGLITAADNTGVARWDRFMTMEFVDPAGTETTEP